MAEFFDENWFFPLSDDICHFIFYRKRINYCGAKARMQAVPFSKEIHLYFSKSALNPDADAV